METGSRLKVPSDRLVKPGIEPATPGYKASGLSTTPQRLLNMLVDLRVIMVASTKFQFDYGKTSPRMSTLSLTD